MAKSKQAFDDRQNPDSLKQGYVRKEDLQPEADDGKVMTADEVDSYAREAESGAKTKGDKLQGEGDYEAAESYNNAATDYAQNQDAQKARRP
jgi:hypothetical protein